MAEAEKTSTPRVLIVADDEELRAFAEELLAKGEFTTRSVSSGSEALECTSSETFDLILLDLDLKGQPDGLAICKELKGTPRLAWMPIMFLTGAAGGEAVVKTFEAGADEFLVKPFKPDELSVRARVLVRKGREERWLVERARKLAEKIAERDDELDDLRRFAQDIVSSLPSALMVLDSEGTILFVNGPLLELLEAERRDVVGRKIAEFFSAEDLSELIERALEAAGREGQPSRLRRVTGFSRENHNRVCDLTVAPIDYAGVRQVLVVVEDVTDQARAESALETERAKLTDVVNAMNAALCLIDRDRRVLWKNRTFDLWFGEARDQPGAQAFHQRLKQDDSWFQPVFGQGQVRHLTWQVFTSLGQPRHFTSIIAPVKSEGGRPADQALLLTQDVSDQESHIEQLTLLRELSQLLRGTLEAQRLNHTILLCVSAGHALGFNRAFLFKRNRENNLLEGKMAVGPTSREEAFRIWGELSSQGRSLSELVSELSRKPHQTPPLFRLVADLSFPLDDPSEIIVRTALEKRPQVVTDAANDERVTDRFRKRFGAQEFVAVPLIAKGVVVGVILADNLYSGRPITEDHVKLLSLFAAQAALAIENADTYAELQMRVSQLHSAQDKIVHAEKLAAVGKMAAHVAHEIRNPLATIGGFARSILKHPENVERVKRNVHVIAEESTRLESMLKGVMDFSRPSPPVLKTADLNAVAEKTFRTHVERLGASNIHADLDLDHSLPEIPFDENQIVQVLTNLIRNAGDSMPNGGALTLRTKRQGEQALLQVMDTGSGIPPEVMERLFSPFFTTKSSGTGLGLAVTRKIVDDHGGRIDIKSQVGQGTTFSVYLPLQRPARLSENNAMAAKED